MCMHAYMHKEAFSHSRTKSNVSAGAEHCGFLQHLAGDLIRNDDDSNEKKSGDMIMLLQYVNSSFFQNRS